jgi:sirohydrochlorin ferrochelatase
MSVEQVMEQYGFRASASCSGQAWYTKFITYNGKRAFVTVTQPSGNGLPESLDEPVVVVTYELRSGDELEAPRRLDSLKAYVESLDQGTKQ